jgi:PAS domain S-box-containing protein
MVEVSCLANRLIKVKAIEQEIRDHRDNLEKLVEDRTETIKEQLHFQQNLLDSMPLPVIFKDAKLKYLGCNAAFEKYLGMTRNKIIGKTVHDVLDEETADQQHAEDRKTLKSGTNTYETTAVFKDGTFHDVIISKAVFMVLDQIGTAKSAVEKRVYRNVKDLILPDLDRLKYKTTTKDQKRDINGIKSNLNKLLSAPTQRISSVYLTLSPREIQIADLIRMGRSTKSIAQLLNITKSAVEFHRNNLREKLGIKHRHINLRSYLMDTE